MGVLEAIPVYLAVTVAAMALGTVTLTTSLVSRVPRLRTVQVGTVYAVITLAVALCGCFVWPSALRVSSILLDVIIPVSVALIVFYPVAKVDEVISRRLAMAATHRSRQSGRSRRSPSGRIRVAPAGIASAPTGSGPNRQENGRRVEFRRRRIGASRTVSLVVLLLTAIGEELLFRGALLAWAEALPWQLGALVIVYSTASFLLLHSGFGWGQVLAKTPLGIAALLCSLPFGTVYGAIVLHCLFNWWYWRRQSWLAATPVSTVATT